MHDAPDLPDGTLTSVLLAGWGLEVVELRYRPVGFGSHHWEARDADGARWFVTVDEDADVPRLSAALSSAVDVAVAVAPLLARDGGPVVVTGRFAVALYPFVDGSSFDFGEYLDDDHRRAALDMVVAVHRTFPRHALVDDLAVPPLPVLGDAGPFARPTAALLAEHADAIAGLRDRYLSLVADVDPARMVLTHGEPHPANTMRVVDGWRLIDWDTALVAPPERDLWQLATDETLGAYEAATGVRVDAGLLEAYRLRWGLTDMSEIVTRFSRPHVGNKDDETSWQIFRDIVGALS